MVFIWWIVPFRACEFALVHGYFVIDRMPPLSLPVGESQAESNTFTVCFQFIKVNCKLLSYLKCSVYLAPSTCNFWLPRANMATDKMPNSKLHNGGLQTNDDYVNFLLRCVDSPSIKYASLHSYRTENPSTTMFNMVPMHPWLPALPVCQLGHSLSSGLLGLPLYHLLYFYVVRQYPITIRCPEAFELKV